MNTKIIHGHHVYEYLTVIDIKMCAKSVCWTYDFNRKREKVSSHFDPAHDELRP